jgi:hypothetical protein
VTSKGLEVLSQPINPSENVIAIAIQVFFIITLDFKKP